MFVVEVWIFELVKFTIVHTIIVLFSDLINTPPFMSKSIQYTGMAFILCILTEVFQKCNFNFKVLSTMSDQLNAIYFHRL